MLENLQLLPVTETATSPRHSNVHMPAPAFDPLAGLIEALGHPDRFRIVERDGELHIEPMATPFRLM